MTVLVDDQTLSVLLRHDLDRPDEPVFTTGHWYLRLCQAVVRGGGGQLSAPVLSLPPDHRQRALGAILELPDDIAILSWKIVAPVMANQVEGAGRGLNLLSREALAAATVLQATVVMAVGNLNRLLAEALRQAGLVCVRSTVPQPEDRGGTTRRFVASPAAGGTTFGMSDRSSSR